MDAPTVGEALFLMLVSGLVCVACFLAVADYRGFLTNNYRKGFEVMAPVGKVLRHVPPWRFLSKDDERNIGGTVLVARISAAFFGVLFAIAFVEGVVGLVIALA